MAKRGRRWVRARVKVWQERLDLEDWKLDLDFRRAKGEADAACSASPEYRHATLYFDLNRIQSEALDSYIVHELLHCHIWGLANVAETCAGKDVGRVEWSRLEEEALTTRLEHVILRLVGPEGSPTG